MKGPVTEKIEKRINHCYATGRRSFDLNVSAERLLEEVDVVIDDLRKRGFNVQYDSVFGDMFIQVPEQDLAARMWALSSNVDRVVQTFIEDIESDILRDAERGIHQYSTVLRDQPEEVIDQVHAHFSSEGFVVERDDQHLDISWEGGSQDE